MSKQITLEFLGMEGTGRNQTEAKQDAGRKIEKAVTGSYTPEILSYRGQSILLYRDARMGWVYNAIDAAQSEFSQSRIWVSSILDGTYQTAKDRALYHLSQMMWTEADGTDVPEFVTDERDRQTLADCFKHYTAHAQAKANGLTDEEARFFADVKRFGNAPFVPFSGTSERRAQIVAMAAELG